MNKIGNSGSFDDKNELNVNNIPFYINNNTINNGLTICLILFNYIFIKLFICHFKI